MVSILEARANWLVKMCPIGGWMVWVSLGMISRYMALRQMRQKDERGRFVPFSLRFVGCDSTRKEGGHFLEYKNVTLPQREIVELEGLDSGSVDAEDVDVKDQRKRGYKSTLTFKTQQGEFKQCHIQLITKFNGQIVF